MFTPMWPFSTGRQTEINRQAGRQADTHSHTHKHTHTQSLVALKSGLLEAVYGTARGVAATGEQRAVIEEYIIALERRNPNARPTDVSSRACTGCRCMLAGWLFVVITMGEDWGFGHEPRARVCVSVCVCV